MAKRESRTCVNAHLVVRVWSGVCGTGVDAFVAAPGLLGAEGLHGACVARGRYAACCSRSRRLRSWCFFFTYVHPRALLSSFSVHGGHCAGRVAVSALEGEQLAWVSTATSNAPHQRLQMYQLRSTHCSGTDTLTWTRALPAAPAAQA